jgi:hypothetical protein
VNEHPIPVVPFPDDVDASGAVAMIIAVAVLAHSIAVVVKLMEPFCAETTVSCPGVVFDSVTSPLSVVAAQVEVDVATRNCPSTRAPEVTLLP